MTNEQVPVNATGSARTGRLLAAAALVTGNPGKLREARRICGAELQAVAIDLPEIQSLDLVRVLESKAAEAYRRLTRPLIVEETGLELAALNGFPGPLVKWMLQAIGPEGLARTALALDQPRAVARCALIYRDGSRSLLAEGVTCGRLVLPARGRGGFGWDPIFQPDGEDRTYAQLQGTEKDRLSHRGRAWRRLVELLRDLR